MLTAPVAILSSRNVFPAIHLITFTKVLVSQNALLLLPSQVVSAKTLPLAWQVKSPLKSFNLLDLFSFLMIIDGMYILNGLQSNYFGMSEITGLGITTSNFVGFAG